MPLRCGAVPQHRSAANTMLVVCAFTDWSATMARSSSSSSAAPAPASVPADSREWTSSENPDPTLPPEPRPDADATTAAPTRSADAPDSIGPGGDSPEQQTGGVVDGGSAPGRQAMNFDDDEIYSGRGKGAATVGTAEAEGGDSGQLGPPSEQLSSSNQASERNP